MKYLLLLVTSYVALVAGDDKTFSVGDASVRIVGNSGKIEYWNNTDSDGEDSKIFIEMDSIIERDAQGEEVGKSGQPKHSFNNFAQLDFTFSQLETGNVEYSNASSKYITFDSKLGDELTSNIKVTTYLVSEDGEVNLSGEHLNILAEQLKFSIELKDWQFCGEPCCDCKDGDGEYVDFTLTLKPKGGNSVSSGNDNEYDLGGGGYIHLSRKVLVDDVWMDMAEGYPLYVEQGSKHMFTFRFPKFSTRAFYDPTINLGSQENGATGTTIHASFLAVFLALVAVLC